MSAAQRCESTVCPAITTEDIEKVRKHAAHVARFSNVDRDDLEGVALLCLTEEAVATDVLPTGVPMARLAHRAVFTSMIDEVRRGYRHARERDGVESALAVHSSFDVELAEEGIAGQVAAAQRRAQTARVPALVAALGGTQAQVVRAFDLEGVAMATVAADLGISVRNAWRARARAHARLRAMLRSSAGAR